MGDALEATQGLGSQPSLYSNPDFILNYVNLGKFLT